MHCDLVETGIGQALLSKFPVSRIGRKAVEKIMARNADHSCEMFDELPKSILDFGELFWIFNIIRNVRSHQPTVLDFDPTCPRSVTPTPKAERLGAFRAAIVAYIGFSASPSGIGLKAQAHLGRLSCAYSGVVLPTAHTVALRSPLDPHVMAGLDPAVCRGTGCGTDGRVKPGHDSEGAAEESTPKAVGIMTASVR
jgi:hypothetical protein